MHTAVQTSGFWTCHLQLSVLPVRRVCPEDCIYNFLFQVIVFDDSLFNMTSQGAAAVPSTTGKDKLDCHLLSLFMNAGIPEPQIDAMGIRLSESLELASWLPGWGVDLLHISCWDAFQGAPDEPDDPRTLTRRFRAALPEGYPLLSTGAIWDGADAAFVLGEGADLVGVARVAIGHPAWPEGLAEDGYAPARPPFTPEVLEAADLSPVFVDYMRRWKGFVTDGRPAD